MALVIPIGGWVNLSGERRENFGGRGGVKKRESPDFRSPEVGISDYVEVRVGTPL